jgi:hypothetical protein
VYVMVQHAVCGFGSGHHEQISSDARRTTDRVGDAGCAGEDRFRQRDVRR